MDGRALANLVSAGRRSALWRFAQARAQSLWGDKRGNVAVISAIVMPVLMAAFGLAFETANWYQTTRLMQNAADSAVIAAASNGTTAYAAEAKAVAAQYGFQDGFNNITVIASNSATCPSGATNCYSVRVSKPVPLVLATLVGYHGNVQIGYVPRSQGVAGTAGTPGQLLLATAVSIQGTSPRTYCLLALASSGAAQGIRSNGAPFANMNGCDVMSNTDEVCNGHNLNAFHGDAHGTSTGCGSVQDSNLAALPDPYLALAANIPANPCGAYPQEPVKKKDPALPASNQLSGSLSWSGTKVFCGDVQLTGDVNLTTSSPGAVLVIENGQLDSNGYTFKTLSSSGLTVIFSGTNAAGYTHAPTGGGTFDITAPTSGTWSGVAVYQDPNLTSGMDISAAGNSPTWDITGLIYLPHASVTFSGAVNKSSNGVACFALVVDNITINGTGSILSEGQCNQAGLSMPTGYIPSRGALVS